MCKGPISVCRAYMHTQYISAFFHWLMTSRLIFLKLCGWYGKATKLQAKASRRTASYLMGPFHLTFKSYWKLIQFKLSSSKTCNCWNSLTTIFNKCQKNQMKNVDRIQFCQFIAKNFDWADIFVHLQAIWKHFLFSTLKIKSLADQDPKADWMCSTFFAK